MTTLHARAESRRDPRRADRVVLGVALVVVGTAWLLHDQGVDVAWEVLPPAGLLVVGVALLLLWWTGGAARAALLWWGAVLLVVSVALGFGAARYAAPAGDVVLAPAASEWPVETRLSAGNVEVDLTTQPLPVIGRLDVQLGAGNLTVVLPDGAPVHVAAEVGTGVIVVDGTEIRDGFDLSWSEGITSAPVVVMVEVALGQVEVRHA